MYRGIKPLNDLLLIRRRSLQHKQNKIGDIILPEVEGAKKSTPHADVLAVGPGFRSIDGTHQGMGVNAGDVVVVPEYAGTEIAIGDETLAMVKETDILAVVDLNEFEKV